MKIPKNLRFSISENYNIINSQRTFFLTFLLLLTVDYINAASSVKFPSKTQPDIAILSKQEGKWIFSNQLFTASFIQHGDKLFFGGSTEMCIEPGTELFELTLGNNTKVKASEMKWQSIYEENLSANQTVLKASEQLPGKALVAILTYGELTIQWRAVLRDSSHYLRTEMKISTSKNIQMKSITPMLYKIKDYFGNTKPLVIGNTRGAVIASNHIFAGLETPLGINSVKSTFNSNFDIYSWNKNSWQETVEAIPDSILKFGFKSSQILVSKGEVNIKASGILQFKFAYKSGQHRMNITGIDLVDETGNIVASDYHLGYAGKKSLQNIYSLNIKNSGRYTLRYFAENQTETINSKGKILIISDSDNNNNEIAIIPKEKSDSYTIISGKWNRNTILNTTDTFYVSSVIGMVAPGQLRRSFLAYLERERAVPWRSFVLYNSWYELNIDRNDNPNPLKRMTEQQCLPILDAWENKLYKPHGISIDAFVWDDGWDDFNSLWDFHIGFPQGFSKLSAKAQEQKSGIGTWLGPVGGYGASKAQRLAFWNKTHSPPIKNFQLSNKEYFDAFIGRCSQMINDYDMRYFKFDGISDYFSATGPKNEEDAEGILKILSALRKKRENIFFNCTVGTWASPFWLQYGDAIWRQEGDFGMIGKQGNSREKWITYRDRLVYQNFVKNSPLCPINSLMTHGLIVTQHGPPTEMSYDNSPATFKEIVKEMRCAFACGTSMVELYLDNDLMSKIGGDDKLWSELASCITWHRNNADVLADTHWVGGNPWDGSKANIYGWAAWNENKATLTLRNPSGFTQTFKITLRKALDIPDFIKGEIFLSSAFPDQNIYKNISEQKIDIDTIITFEMPAFDVIVFNGKKVN